MLGPHDVDRCASFKNRKTQSFHSFFKLESKVKSSRRFTQSWAGCNNWLVPPINSVNKEFFHLLSYKVKATLTVPKWPSFSYCPIAFKRVYIKQEFITEV